MSANFSFFINTWGPLLRLFQQRRGRTRARSSLPRWQGSPVFTCFFKKIFFGKIRYLKKDLVSLLAVGVKVQNPVEKKSNILRETDEFTAFVFICPTSIRLRRCSSRCRSPPPGQSWWCRWGGRRGPPGPGIEKAKTQIVFFLAFVCRKSGHTACTHTHELYKDRLLFTEPYGV